MTPEEFQHWIGNTKVETTIESIIKVDGGYSLIWDYIKVGSEYWFYNINPLLGPMDWMKMKVTYKRSGVYFYKVLDKRYKKKRREEYADITSPFTINLHPAIYRNPDPKYFKPENFDTLGGRVEIV